MSKSWKITRAQKPLRGRVQVPGDKSVSHRAIMIGALCDGPVEISRLGRGQDNGRTGRALAQMGVRLEPLADDRLRVHGVGLDGLRAPEGVIDCGNSGTTMRLLLGLLGGRFSARLDGDEYLRRRPMKRVAAPLAEMGIAVSGAAGAKSDLYAPLDLVAGAAPRAIDYRSPVASAQVKSAVLLAGLRAEGETVVREPALSRDHTERMLRYFGVALDSAIEADGSAVVRLAAGARRLQARPILVPGDLSSAAFLLGAALLVPGSEVTVEGVGLNPSRAGIVDALLQMGASVTTTPHESSVELKGEPEGEVTAFASSLRGTRIGGALSVRSIDELPLLAALAVHAEGETIVTDAEELRVKESDRVAASANMLRAFGAGIDERADGWVIAGRGRALHAAEVQSEGDHRIAMAAAVVALAVDGETVIHDVANVATSFPTFVTLLRQLGAELTEI